MKAQLLATLYTVIGVLCAQPALAASQREDGSGLLVWAFLGFCALIIVAQLLPALFVLLGIIKGVAGEAKPAAAQSSTSGDNE